jgi:hypothetical protein
MTTIRFMGIVVLYFISGFINAIDSLPWSHILSPNAALHDDSRINTNNPTTSGTYIPYIIVGSGPAGLQTAYAFQYDPIKRKQYTVFERNTKAGSFFEHFPRHRKLISINKRHVGSSSPEMHLRHDWNSLLSSFHTNTSQRLLFTSYSNDFYPQADKLVQYLNDYREHYQLNVSFGFTLAFMHKEIFHVDHAPSSELASSINSSSPLRSQFVLYMYKTSEEELHPTARSYSIYRCSTLIMATGLSRWNTAEVSGGDLLDTYAKMSTNADLYANQSVLILGKGNSAFETAAHLLGSAAQVHLMGRSPFRLAYQTHYVGDVRAAHNDLLDAYQLKSMGGVLETPVNKYSIEFRKIDGKIEAIPAGEIKIENWIRLLYDRVIVAMGARMDPKPFYSSSSPACWILDSHNHNLSDVDGLRQSVDSSCVCTYNMLTKQDECRRILYEVTHHGKYPKLNPYYESVNVKRLYFAGSLMHGHDFRKSAGGFIHGFRYSIMMLNNIINWREHGVSIPYWPVEDMVHLVQPNFIQSFLSVNASNDHCLTLLQSGILHRINDASSMYQKFGFMGDIVILYLNRNGALQFQYHKDVDIMLLGQQEFRDHLFRNTSSWTSFSTPAANDQEELIPIGLLTVTLELNECFSDSNYDQLHPSRLKRNINEAHLSNFLHPIIRFYLLPFIVYEEEQKVENFMFKEFAAVSVHHMHEELNNDFTHAAYHIKPFNTFLSKVLADIQHVHVEITKGYSVKAVPLRKKKKRLCGLEAIVHRLKHIVNFSFELPDDWQQQLEYVLEDT